MSHSFDLTKVLLGTPTSAPTGDETIDLEGLTKGVHLLKENERNASKRTWSRTTMPQMLNERKTPSIDYHQGPRRTVVCGILPAKGRRVTSVFPIIRRPKDV
ncbi:hypothetical protein ACTXT7_010030 [Hymenolepis weldensis]